MNAPRFPTPPPSAPRSLREITYVKAGHRYGFRYELAYAPAVVGALLTMALDPRFNLDLDDVKLLMRMHGLAEETLGA